MKNYEVAIDKEKIYKAVYNITANAAAQRGDGLRVATEDNDILLDEFLEKGKKLVEAALGRYGNGLKYSMPSNWPEDLQSEVNANANDFLKSYVIARWYALNDAGMDIDTSALDRIKVILGKRMKE